MSVVLVTGLSPHLLVRFSIADMPPSLRTRRTDLCHPDEMGDDDSSLWGGGLAEHHELDPLGDAVEESDETLQDGVVHRAAMHHKAVVVLKLKWGRGHHSKVTGVEM